MVANHLCAAVFIKGRGRSVLLSKGRQFTLQEGVSGFLLFDFWPFFGGYYEYFIKLFIFRS